MATRTERVRALMRDHRVTSALFLTDPDMGEQVPGSDALVSQVFLGMLGFRDGLGWHNQWVSQIPPQDLQLSVSIIQELQRLREHLVKGLLEHHPPEILWSLVGFERVN